MPCEVKKHGETVLVVCSRRTGVGHCRCGRACTKLCDFPVERAGKVTTCDAKLCSRCATHVGHEKDLCPPHSLRDYWDYENGRPKVGPGAGLA